MSSTVNAEGQVNIPKAYLDRLGLSPGDSVAIKLQRDQKIVLTKASGAPGADVESYKRRLESVRGIIDGVTTDEIMRLTRGDDWA